jgi:hypothetical protein
MSFFLSEVYAIKDKVTLNLETVLCSIPPGAAVLYIDNDHSVFTDYANSLFTPDFFELVHSENARLVPPTAEQTSDLGAFNKDRYRSSAKAQSYCAIRVWKKLNPNTPKRM